MMADVVAAPKHAVVSHRNEWLDHVIFKNEGPFAKGRLRPAVHGRMDIGRKRIAKLFQRIIELAPHGVDLAISDADKGDELARRVGSKHVFERDHRKSEDLPLGDVLLVYDEGLNVVV